MTNLLLHCTALGGVRAGGAAMAPACRSVVTSTVVISRRCAVATSAGGLALFALASAGLPLPAAHAAPEPMESVDVSAYRKIPGGGRYADLTEGRGAEVVEGSKVSLQWVLRRSNGYYVDGSVKMLSTKSGAAIVDPNFDEANNFLFTVGDGSAMAGVDAGVRGMRQGGKRRLVLPTKVAYTLPIGKSAGPLPDGYGPQRQIERELQRDDPYNYFYLEVEATRVR
uniref:peptidylprolyl isomerase n=1 Tax=Coccolithus braarudii TaxID=221442 RepID=A0A7S0PZC8_9EUKA